MDRPRIQYGHSIAPDPPNGFVDITDVSRLNGLFRHTCTP